MFWTPEHRSLLYAAVPHEDCQLQVCKGLLMYKLYLNKQMLPWVSKSKAMALVGPTAVALL